MFMTDYKSAMSMDLGVKNTFYQVGKFVNMGSRNNEHWPYVEMTTFVYFIPGSKNKELKQVL